MINIDRLKEDLIERLKPIDPEKIIIFGSYAKGVPNDNSDIDLYVVTNDNDIPNSYSERRKLVRAVSRQIQDLREKISIDLIVHTKLMSKNFFKFNSSFANEISEHGIVIYE